MVWGGGVKTPGPLGGYPPLCPQLSVEIQYFILTKKALFPLLENNRYAPNHKTIIISGEIGIFVDFSRFFIHVNLTIFLKELCCLI